MQNFDIEEVRANLGRLLAGAAEGHSFIISNNGKSLVKVEPLTWGSGVARGGSQRLGFMTGQCHIPDDFDASGSDEIAKLFYGDL